VYIIIHINKNTLEHAFILVTIRSISFYSFIGQVVYIHVSHVPKLLRKMLRPNRLGSIAFRFIPFRSIWFILWHEEILLVLFQRKDTLYRLNLRKIGSTEAFVCENVF